MDRISEGTNEYLVPSQADIKITFTEDLSSAPTATLFNLDDEIPKSPSGTIVKDLSLNRGADNKTWSISKSNFAVSGATLQYYGVSWGPPTNPQSMKIRTYCIPEAKIQDPSKRVNEEVTIAISPVRQEHNDKIVDVFGTDDAGKRKNGNTISAIDLPGNKWSPANPTVAIQYTFTDQPNNYRVTLGYGLDVKTFIELYTDASGNRSYRPTRSITIPISGVLQSAEKPTVIIKMKDGTQLNYAQVGRTPREVVVDFEAGGASDQSKNAFKMQFISVLANGNRSIPIKTIGGDTVATLERPAQFNPNTDEWGKITLTVSKESKAQKQISVGTTTAIVSGLNFFAQPNISFSPPASEYCPGDTVEIDAEPSDDVGLLEHFSLAFVSKRGWHYLIFADRPNSRFVYWGKIPVDIPCGDYELFLVPKDSTPRQEKERTNLRLKIDELKKYAVKKCAIKIEPPPDEKRGLIRFGDDEKRIIKVTIDPAQLEPLSGPQFVRVTTTVKSANGRQLEQHVSRLIVYRDDDVRKALYEDYLKSLGLSQDAASKITAEIELKAAEAYTLVGVSITPEETYYLSKQTNQEAQFNYWVDGTRLRFDFMATLPTYFRTSKHTENDTAGKEINVATNLGNLSAYFAGSIVYSKEGKLVPVMVGCGVNGIDISNRTSEDNVFFIAPISVDILSFLNLQPWVRVNAPEVLSASVGGMIFYPIKTGSTWRKRDWGRAWDFSISFSSRN